MLPSFLQALLTVAQLLSVSVGAATDAAPVAELPPTCGPALTALQSTVPLPAGVSGRVRFYAALYGAQGLPLRAVGLGPGNELQPLASTFKSLVVRAALQDVDAGRFTLGTLFQTTAANRSIESYPAGRNSLQSLVNRAIFRSDNTAADILHLAVGPARLALDVHRLSPCTSILLTTKAWWSVQAGLTAGVLGGKAVADGPADEATSGARTYRNLPFAERVAAAQRLNAAAQQVGAPVLEAALDGYFHGAAYTPQLELDVQNTSTVSAFADLLARTMPGDGLQPGTRQLYRQVLTTGCCRPARPRLPARLWAAKAGSGWRVLNLTGYVETTGGQRLAYAYFNDQSDTQDSEDMERQIRPVVQWIEANLLTLTAAR